MPDLTIIAGCNGAGKSTYALSFLPDGQISFDYDKVFLTYYRALPDSELRDTIAKNKTTDDFESAIKHALDHNFDFCYETNFDAHPIHWTEKFKKLGYSLNLVFFCLENQEIAKHRVEIRVEFDEHFVDDETINFKWREGYKNLNTYYSFFDKILIVDNSANNESYKNLVQIENGKSVLMTDKLPPYFSKRLPGIFKLISIT